MSTKSDLEYAALRATIRERGTIRIVLGWMTVAVWAVLATIAFPPAPFTTLIQLLVLAAGFEALYALYLNVERIGRYVQVFHERDEDRDAWEHTSMAFGRSFPGTGTDPLFGAVFALAVLLNIAPAVVTRPGMVASGILTAAHVLVLGRIVVARERASRQRAEDLARFETLLRNGGGPASDQGSDAADDSAASRQT